MSKEILFYIFILIAITFFIWSGLVYFKSQEKVQIELYKSIFYESYYDQMI